MPVDAVFSYLHSLPSAVSTGCGVLGFCLYLTNYTLVTFRILCSQHIPFFAINIAAAGLVLISLVQNFNLGSVLIQVFWIGLGIIAITIRLRARAAWHLGYARRQKPGNDPNPPAKKAEPLNAA